MRSATLYALPGSHPVAAVAALLDARRLAYTRVDLVPILSRVWLRALGFRGSTVPALRLDGRRIVGSREIMRAVGADPGRDDIDAWGESMFQGVARRIALWGLARSRAGTASVLAETRLHPPLPRSLALLVAPLVLRVDGFINGASRAAVDADLAALPEHLDRVDGWLAAGELGSDPPTAADYQVAGSLRLLLVFDDLAPLFDGRPAAGFARRVIPRFAGRVPAGLLRPRV